MHSFKHGTADDKRMAGYILKNELKGVVIANFFTFMLYFSRFKTYRSSHLLTANLLSSLLGLGLAA